MLLGGVIGMGTTTAICLANGINPIDGGKLSFKFRKMCNDPLLFGQNL